MDEREREEGIVVPYEKLSPEALEGVIDEFITREGTDYGHGEPTLEEKRRAVRAQLARGEALVLFDPKTETVTLARSPSKS